MLRAVCSARMALVIAVNVPPSTTSMMPIDTITSGSEKPASPRAVGAASWRRPHEKLEM